MAKDGRSGASNWPLVVLCISLLVVTVQTTILNVALPDLVRDLGASDSQLQWIVDGYIVAFAGVLLTGSALADRFGRRGVMNVGQLICGATSIGGALSSTPMEVIIWRSAMGVGAALVMPATLSILVNVYTEPARRTRAIAYWSLMNAVGSFIGPIAGGLLLRWASWNSCLYVNLPFVAATVILSHWLVPTSRDHSQARFDVLGAMLSTLALGAFVWGIIEGPDRGWASPSILISFAVAVACGGAFIWWERHTTSPMLDLPLFSRPQFSAAAVALTIAFLAMSGAMYLAGLALQFVKGYTPLGAAIAVSAPVTVVNFLIVPRAAWLIRRLGIRTAVAGGIAVIAVSAAVLSAMTVHSSYLWLGVGFALMAVAFSTFVPASTEAIMSAVPRERSGGASAVNEITRQIGQAIGIALSGGLAIVGYRSHLHPAALPLPPTVAQSALSSVDHALAAAAAHPSYGPALAEQAKIAYIDGIRLALLVSAGAALLGAAYAALGIPARRRTPAGFATPAADPLPVQSAGDDQRSDGSAEAVGDRRH